jgi:hypothetical protein
VVKRFWVIHRVGVTKNQPLESTLILVGIKGERYPCAGAPTRTNGEFQLSDTLVKHCRVPFPLFNSE